MRYFIIFSMVLIFAGCATYIGPGGTYIEPLPEAFFVGPPVVVAPPVGVVVQPLPPVVVIPDRRVYFYGDHYYYNWENRWYWGRDRRGPWHELPRDRWPSRMERRR